MKAIENYFLITPDDLHWRPSNMMKIPNADFLSEPRARILARGSGVCRPTARTRSTSTSVRRSFILCWKAWAPAHRRRDVDRAEIWGPARRARPVASGVQRYRRRGALAYRR